MIQRLTTGPVTFLLVHQQYHCLHLKLLNLIDPNPHNNLRFDDRAQSIKTFLSSCAESLPRSSFFLFFLSSTGLWSLSWLSTGDCNNNPWVDLGLCQLIYIHGLTSINQFCHLYKCNKLTSEDFDFFGGFITEVFILPLKT